MKGEQLQPDSLGIIWDFDGTLFDTRRKNWAVTRAIVEEILGRSPDQFPILQSVDEYDRAQRRCGNWREFYMLHLELDEAGTDHAGRFWVEFQLRDMTRAEPIEGVSEVIEELVSIPQGIVSQNSRQVILQTLESSRIQAFFRSVIGHEEVPIRRQKPAPDGILLCRQELDSPPRRKILFVGDHETDARTAHNANRQAQELGLECRFYSVAAAYHAEVNPDSWAQRPDFVARDPADILDLVEQLEG